MVIRGFQWRLQVLKGNYGFSLTIRGFHWQSWVFNGDHGFVIVLMYSCTFDNFFHYRSIRIYTHVLLVFIKVCLHLIKFKHR